MSLNPISRRAVTAIFVATLAFAVASPVIAQSPTSSPQPASVFSVPVLWLTTSPAYSKTGLVAAVDFNFTLWVSHNGGTTWVGPKSAGFTFRRPMITIDSSGHEVMFDQGDKTLERSDDGGKTWIGAGPAGQPTAIPGSSGEVAVAGTTDYILRNGTPQNVAGSGGTLADRFFAFSPAFPKVGKYPPALLVGADPKTGQPVVQHCTAELTCSGSVSLPAAQGFIFPVDLLISKSYADDGVVFARTGVGVFKSSDGGATFKPVTIVPGVTDTLSTPLMTLAPDYREAGPVRTAYLSVASAGITGGDKPSAGGVYRTADGGTTWKRVGSSLLDWGSTSVTLAPDGRLLAGFFGGRGAGLLCSTDNKTWVVSCPSFKASAKGSGSKAFLWAGLLGLVVLVAVIVLVRRITSRAD